MLIALPSMAHAWIPFSFSLYLSILLKLKFTPVRDHFPKCSESKIKWTTGGGKIEYPLIMIIKLSTLQQMLLEYLTSKGNDCCNLECCQISPTDKPLRWIHIWKQNITWSVKLAEITQSGVKGGARVNTEHGQFGFGEATVFSLSFAACIKCEFRAFPSNSLVLGFLNINIVRLLSVILNNGAQNNTSQISVTGKIFVV